jgi:hypothetical protein
LAIVSLLLVCQLPGFSRVDPEPHEEHARHAGLLIGSVYNVHEGRWMVGLGAEYEYVLPGWNRLFGVGLGGEMVFDEHKHYVAGLLLSVHPTDKLAFFISPGVMVIEREEPGTRFAIHFGTEYEFDLEKFFLAPSSRSPFRATTSISCWGYTSASGFRRTSG